MDAIALLMTLFLNLNEPCTALPADLQRLNGQDYQVLHYDCGAKRFKIWSQKCQPGDYWGRPFFLEEENSQTGLYMNRFAEIHAGFHVSLAETYVPRCGS